jgi:hypothetical protein
MLKVRLINNSPPNQWDNTPDGDEILRVDLKQVSAPQPKPGDRWRQPEVPLIRGGEYAWFNKPEPRYTYLGTIDQRDVRDFRVFSNPTNPDYEQQVLQAVAKHVRSTPEDDVQPGSQEIFTYGGYDRLNIQNIADGRTPEDRRLFVFKTGKDHFMITASSRGLKQL